MDKIIVTILGGGLIGFIWWFFFGKNEEDDFSGNDVLIKVNGGYNPGNIVVKKYQKIKLRFLRTDPSSCLEEIVIPDFKIKRYLPLNEEVKIEFIPKEKGVYPMHCGMNMYHGKITVR
jgi:plastocyanin domain-containing protein